MTSCHLHVLLLLCSTSIRQASKIEITSHTDLTQISVLRCSTKERRLKLCTETFWVELEWRIYHGEIIMGMNLSSTILSANKIGIYFSRSNDSLAPLHST